MNLLKHGAKWVMQQPLEITYCPECSADCTLMDVKATLDGLYTARLQCNRCRCEIAFQRQEEGDEGQHGV